MIALLRDWSVRGDPDPYRAPETRTTHLAGIVFGHPRKADGKKVITTRIVAATGRNVTTRSGTVYELVGPPDAEYAAWCQKHGIALDLENPIRMLP